MMHYLNKRLALLVVFFFFFFLYIYIDFGNNELIYFYIQLKSVAIRLKKRVAELTAQLNAVEESRSKLASEKEDLKKKVDGGAAKDTIKATSKNIQVYIFMTNDVRLLCMYDFLQSISCVHIHTFLHIFLVLQLIFYLEICIAYVTVTRTNMFINIAVGPQFE